jgi:hypothetical protein
LPDGKLFEHLIIERAARIMAKVVEENKVEKKVQKDYFMFATEQEDRKFGTDFFAYGVPMDVTLDFDGKDKLEVLPGRLKLDDDGNVVKFGMRFGNAHHDFETAEDRANPKVEKLVLVIAFAREDKTFTNPDDLRIKRGEFKYLVQQFEKNFTTIIEEAQAAYWDKRDELDEQLNQIAV